MNLEIKCPDPLKILTTTRHVVENSRSVYLNPNSISTISPHIEQRLKQGLETPDIGFGAKGNFAEDAQLIFFQTVTNFCFWSQKDQPRWQVEWPKGTYQSGFYGLAAAFQRAQVKYPQIFNPDYLSQAVPSDLSKIFQSSNNTQIPLLDERIENLIEAGKVLKEKYQGKFANCLEAANFDAIKIAKKLYQEFPSFKDISILNQNEVFILKRAQIGPNDISYLSKMGGPTIKNLDQLTAFADYKIPQMLREANILIYSQNLTKRIDNYEIIPPQSPEEVEIRSATIWGVELIRQSLKKYTAAQIDNALWLISQDQSGLKPYHRTYSIYY